MTGKRLAFLKEKAERIAAERPGLLVCLFIVIATVFSYWQVQYGGFIGFDDGAYVVRNHHIKYGFTWETLQWAFQDMQTGTWHPLTWLSLILDYLFFGLWAGGYHLTNLAFHIANALLLFSLFKKMTGEAWKSAFVALLFALHPINVESVAWIAERKNLLSTFLWFLSLWLYAGYVRTPGPARYLAFFTAFFLGLLAKAMLVTLPFTLLLLDYWPLGRLATGPASAKNPLSPPPSSIAGFPWRHLGLLVIEKLPLFFLSTLFSWITYEASRLSTALMSMESMSLTARMANAVLAYVKYLGKMFYPSSLAVFYPLPDHFPPWQIAAAIMFLLAVTVLALFQRNKKSFLAVGWFWYLGTLVPVIGLMQVGSQSMADRYAYVPLVGVFVMLVWGFSDLWRRRPRRKQEAFLFTLLIIVAMMSLTWRQTGYWRNGVTLFSHAAAVTGGNYLAQDNLAVALMETGDANKALEHFKEALTIYPRYASAYNNRGNLYQRMGRWEEATVQYEKALEIDSGFTEARYNMGTLFLRMGKADEARKLLEEVVRGDADNADAHENLGVALAMQGRMREAAGHFRRALEINPSSSEARENLRRIKKPQ